MVTYDIPADQMKAYWLNLAIGDRGMVNSVTNKYNRIHHATEVEVIQPYERIKHYGRPDPKPIRRVIGPATLVLRK